MLALPTRLQGPSVLGGGLGPRLAEPTAALKGHEGQMKREARSTRPEGWSWAMNLDTGAAIHTGPTAPLVLKPPSPENSPYPLSECWGGWRWGVRGSKGGGLGMCPPQAVSLVFLAHPRLSLLLSLPGDSSLWSPA